MSLKCNWGIRILFLASLPLPALAQTPPAAKPSTQIIQLSGEKENYRKNIDELIQKMTPAHLPPAEKQTRANAARAATDFSRLQPQIEKVYESNFTPQELSSLLTFLQTPAGKKFLTFQNSRRELFKNLFTAQYNTVRAICAKK